MDDAIDPFTRSRSRFVPAPGIVAYLDGNSLGRPLKASVERIARFADEQWGGRLIRGWDEGWLDLPLAIGDRLGLTVLGAAAGQTTIGDSTTVLLYKLIRAAVALDPYRTEIVIDRDDFPTDRYLVEGIAAETGSTVRWIDEGDVTPDRVAEVVGDRTAVVVLSHVAYRSGYLAEVAEITRVVHEAGALVLWDLCHSAGVADIRLDEWGVDLAVGCTYKYLNGGPGSPAFAYVRTGLQSTLRQPIQGWLGSAAPFEMGQGYTPAAGIRGFVSGTPPIVGMLAMQDTLDLIEEIGLAAIRERSVALTSRAIELADERIPDAVLATPREPARRGSHITLDHPGFRAVMPKLWARGVVPDFRAPDGIRIGLSPLSTSFDELEVGIDAIAQELAS